MSVARKLTRPVTAIRGTDSSVTVSTEDQVYADQNVIISTTRIIVNGVTYPLSNVSSVRLLSRSPNYLFPILAVIVGLFALAGGKDTGLHLFADTRVQSAQVAAEGG